MLHSVKEGLLFIPAGSHQPGRERDGVRGQRHSEETSTLNRAVCLCPQNQQQSRHELMSTHGFGLNLQLYAHEIDSGMEGDTRVWFLTDFGDTQKHCFVRDANKLSRNSSL